MLEWSADRLDSRSMVVTIENHDAATLCKDWEDAKLVFVLFPML